MYPVQQLQSIHREVIRRIALGHKQREISTELGVSKRTVQNAVASPLGKKQLRLLEEAKDLVVKKILVDGSESAAKLLVDVVNNDEAGLGGKANISERLRASESILGRTQPEVSRHDHRIGLFDAADILKIKETAAYKRQEAMDVQDISDATFTDSERPRSDDGEA